VTAFEDRLAAVDARLTRFREEAKVPAVAWGVIRDRELVHTGGAGTIRDGEDARPDADSVNRIASMTKSFTAAAIEALVAAPGADGRAELAITVEPETGVVTACTMQAPERVAPIEGWQDG